MDKRWLLLGAAVMLRSSLVFAEDANLRASRAHTDCLTGKVESGVTLLAELFSETGNPNFLYNQARCYEQNGRFEEAVNRFREYLRVAKGTGADERAEVERHISDCRQLEAEKQRQLALAPPVNQSAPTAAVAVTQAPPARAVGSRLRLAGLVAGGVGVAGLATGVVFSLLVRSTQQQVESDARKRQFDPALDHRGRTYESLQWVGYGAGAGLLVVGGVLYWFGERWRRDEQITVAIFPGDKYGAGGLAVKGRF